MLVLSRKRNESIVIPLERPATDERPAETVLIELVVVEIRGDKVRLAIGAPPEIPVHRREVYEAIQRQAALAAASQESHPQKELTTDVPQVA